MQKIRVRYVSQVRKVFEQTPLKNHWENGLDVLLNIFQLMPDFTKAMAGLEDILITNPTDYSTLCGFSSYLEGYLKLIIQLTQPTSTTGLGDCISLLNAGKEPPNTIRECIKKAKDARNDMSHEAEADWKEDDEEIIRHRKNFLVALVYYSVRHDAVLKDAIQQQLLIPHHDDLKEYLKSVIQEFECWKTRFVFLQSYKKINLFAQEELDDFGINTELREGSVEELWGQCNRKMFLSGKAGMGKTTSLQYLALTLAEKCRKSNAAKIPVYLELKSAASGETLTDLLQRKLLSFFSQGAIDTYLQQARLILLLDGLNELTPENQNRIRENIQTILKEFPALDILVSGREPHSFTLPDHSNIPVCTLREMTPEQVRLFIKQYTNEQHGALLMQLIGEDEVLKEWLTIPMYLVIMLDVTTDICKKYPLHAREKLLEVVEDQAFIIQNFVKKIFEREYARDAKFNALVFEVLLIALALDFYESGKTTCTELQLIKTLKPHREDFPDTDLSYFLKICKGLGLLVENNFGDLSFAHDAFLEYFASRGLEL